MTSSPSTHVIRRSALLDITLIIGVLVILKSLLLNVNAIWSFAGPVSLLVSLAVATWCLWRRRESWVSLGLSRPKSIGWILLWTVGALIVTMGVGILADSLTISLLDAPSEAVQAIDSRYQGRFDSVRGNPQVYLYWLVVAWVIGGFAEEMLFRGALLTRFEALFSGAPYAAIIAVICQAILFGHQHLYYQGVAGWVATGAIGLVSGLLYLAFDRNLWPLVLSHGVSNTIGLTLIYLGMMG
ncbi:MAG: CPBP family intramembrane glutamic endopeptidase [Alphaproteobacteria bacterium]